MWAYIVTFLVGAIPAFVLFLLWRSERKGRRAADKERTECRGVVERLRDSLKESDDDNDRLRRTIQVGTADADACSSQVTDAIKEATARGDDASLLHLVSGAFERVRIMSEAVADRGDEDAELRRRHRAPTAVAAVGSD